MIKYHTSFTENYGLGYGISSKAHVSSEKIRKFLKTLNPKHVQSEKGDLKREKFGFGSQIIDKCTDKYLYEFKTGCVEVIEKYSDDCTICQGEAEGTKTIDISVMLLGIPERSKLETAIKSAMKEMKLKEKK
ncbi:hypothetical protein JXB27_01975 [Candidatus Woesearchaeota archaeon]|nr:hypothetical protein [Candidatus Woesearchaeota archaeon]